MSADRRLALLRSFLRFPYPITELTEEKLRLLSDILFEAYKMKEGGKEADAVLIEALDQGELHAFSFRAQDEPGKKGKKGQPAPAPVPVAGGKRERVGPALLEIAAQIRSGLYPPPQRAQTCKRCDFRATCPSRLE